MTKEANTRTDSPVVELVGRSWLISQLLRAGLEVPRPERDRGIDLIAYLDLDEKQSDFLARPIQVKAFTRTRLRFESKYERFPRMLLVYVWNVNDSGPTSAYAFSYREGAQHS